jgi:formylmethanofuran dehydrogenase subunit E
MVESSTRGSSGACEEMESGTGELAIRTIGREVVTVATGVESGNGELAIRTTGREVVTVATGMESGTGW